MICEFDKNGYDTYLCDGCRSARGRSIAGTGCPDGWTEPSTVGRGTHLCPRCTAKRDAKEAAREAKEAEKRANTNYKTMGMELLAIILCILVISFLAVGYTN